MTHEQKLEHMLSLKREVVILKDMLQPHNTRLYPINTTINMLENRIKCLYREVYSSESRND
jgi:hypothetical protein